MGGAQAVAALAFGTATVPKVAKITGPGNIFVTLAKKAVYGHCDIDMLAGPSEILIVADGSADPQYLAADLLSQAEHDPLTDLLNRGSFDKLIHIYETGESPFALILVDVDVFKEVNDTFGHGIGDQILRKVASVLKKQFRNIDYVCRIGGDEFAVIMVNSASDKRCTIKKKIEEANEELSNPTDSLPAVSLSVGVAFSDRKNPKGSISNDADAALYYIKEHGRHNCGFYGQLN